MSAHNDLVSIYQDQSLEIQRLKDKMTDLEDSSRRNNVKIRGIPESVTQPELFGYLKSAVQKDFTISFQTGSPD